MKKKNEKRSERKEGIPKKEKQKEGKKKNRRKKEGKKTGENVTRVTDSKTSGNGKRARER